MASKSGPGNGPAGRPANGPAQSTVHIPPPPDTPRRTVTDTVHGKLIEDPYRWLEDCESPETLEWIEDQNRRTEAVLAQVSQRQEFARRIEALLSQDTIGTPVLRGDTLFYTRRSGGANQPVLCVRKVPSDCGAPGQTAQPEQPERVILDPNTLSGKGIVALDWWQPSPDGSMLAYGCSEGGDEWSVLHVLDVATGEVLPDTIKRARYAGVTWKPDNSGFYYCRYPKPGEVPPGDEFYYRKVFYHTIGHDPDKDPVVFGHGRPKHQMFGASLSEDGRYLLVSASHGWNSTDMYFRDETDPDSPFVPIVEGEDAIFRGRVLGDTLYMLTNYQAPRYRVLAVDLRNPRRDGWREIIPESPDFTLGSFHIAAGRIIVSGLKDASSRLYVYNLDGTGKQEIPLPTLGTITGITCKTFGREVYFGFQSFTRPNTVYRLRLDACARVVPEPVFSGTQTVDPDSICVKQVFYSSYDGTRIPMFILHLADLEFGHDSRHAAPGQSTGRGPRPTVLTGYGGFNSSNTPSYAPAVIPWIQSGGVYAVANLRGGGEYGEEWHRAGMLDRKQNVFDDFAAAAECLIAGTYTTRDLLGISGRSNGGLLVGAALTQRPDLYRAVVCGVPLLDMVRYHKFLIAYLWTSEYGDPDNPEHFKWLYEYSPYHHISPGTSYPAVYTFTAASDTRVHPMHALKMTAALQYNQTPAERGPAGKPPVLLHVEFEAGHGVGKPLYKIVQEQSNIWAFFAWQLGLKKVAPEGALEKQPNLLQ